MSKSAVKPSQSVSEPAVAPSVGSKRKSGPKDEVAAPVASVAPVVPPVQEKKKEKASKKDVAPHEPSFGVSATGAASAPQPVEVPPVKAPASASAPATGSNKKKRASQEPVSPDTSAVVPSSQPVVDHHETSPSSVDESSTSGGVVALGTGEETIDLQAYTDSFIKRSRALVALAAELTKEVKEIERQNLKLLKSVDKGYKQLLKKNHKKRKVSNNAPSGFRKPKYISPQMAEFLHLSKDAMISTPQAVKLIHTYLVDNNLRLESDKRIILPDQKICNLLKISSDTIDKHEFRYFQIQKYLKPHFSKTPFTPEQISAL